MSKLNILNTVAIFSVKSSKTITICYYYNLFEMAANIDSPRSPPLNEQTPNNPRLGIEFPLGLPEHMPQQEMTPSPVAPDEDHDNFAGLYYRVDVEALDEWATVTSFMRGSIGYVVQEPEITDDFKQFLIRMYGSN